MNDTIYTYIYIYIAKAIEIHIYNSIFPLQAWEMNIVFIFAINDIVAICLNNHATVYLPH